ncbi:MAG: hypothetical protein H6779_00840 [Candidatus Nomurabacteria bacterium]|nr:hypothetical protein [Candidatus Nomurabacteria bacterium]USN87976.1 MAG: hypothetical protein H6779_00840 [Candidatus Nomurabacteria bacterium]
MLDHHAFLIRSNLTNRQVGEELICELKIEEISYIEKENFGIDDARELVRLAFLKPGQGDAKLLVVILKKITSEAQQALLKLLEEPPSTTKFIFLVGNDTELLPTLLSRFQTYEGSYQGTETNTTDDFADFCKLNYAQRLVLIGKNLDAKGDWVVNIKVGLAKYLSKRANSLDVDTMHSLLVVVTSLNTRGASNKMLLEEMALLLPPGAEK